MINPNRFYVVDKERGIALRQYRRPSDGYSTLFTWDKPEIRACGMSWKEADDFIARYSGVPGCSELAAFCGREFLEACPESLKSFSDRLFQRVNVYAEYNGVRRTFYSNLPKWTVDLNAWKQDNPELENWQITPVS